MKTFTGIPASAGFAFGKALVYLEDDFSEISQYSIDAAQIDSEWERLQRAIAMAADEVKSLYERASRQMAKEQADIFQAHLFMLEDTDFQEQLRERLAGSLRNIEWVVWDTSRELSQKLMASPDPVFRERAADITDVARRVISCLLSVKRKKISFDDIDGDVILVTRDLMPSDVLAIGKSRVKGLAMDVGSRTSHTAILARAFNIPAVLGLSNISTEIQDGQMIALNGFSGLVIADPDQEALGRQLDEEKKFREQTDRLNALRDLPAQTLDGHRVTLKANIEVPEEVELALRYGAEGIGLYRSEFLFVSPENCADEESQYNAYSQVIKAMGNLPVTIRTLDVGGDKVLPELRVQAEKNPLLGWRAIRISLAERELFKMQLRAILRAAVYGDARIMFPMISGIEELEQALALLEEARDECKKKGQLCAEKIETGIMVEIPSAAMTADILAEKSDFFSLGTNDLTQYSLAVDRGNEKVSYLGDPCHPAMLRFIKRTIDAAHEKGIKAAMCGEFAGDPHAAALLVGLGLDEFSMTASSIPLIKQIIRSSSLESCRALAEQALAGRSTAAVHAAIQAWLADNSVSGAI